MMKTRQDAGSLRKSLVRRMRRVIGIKGEEGSTLVEFAMTLPLLVAVLMGTGSFSVALYVLQQMGNATSGATQYLGEEAGLITDPCQTVVTSVTGSLPNLAPAKLTYTLTISYADSSNPNKTDTITYGPTTGSSFSCTAGTAYITPNYPVTLTVQYAYTWLPVLNFSPKSPLTVTESALAE